MTYPHIKPELKARIKPIVPERDVKAVEFGKKI